MNTIEVQPAEVTPAIEKTLAGKVFLLTGASRGISLARMRLG